MKWHKDTTVLIGFIFLVSIIGTSQLRAQDDFKKWLKEQDEKYQAYKDKRDKAFVDFLQQEWKKMQMMQGVKPDPEPKPVKMPEAKPEKKPKPEPEKPVEKIEDIKIKKPRPKPNVIPPPELPSSEKKLEQKVVINFFNSPLTVFCDKAIFFNFDDNISKESIAAFWAKQSQADYESFLQQLLKVKELLSLNDWGLAELLYKTGEKVYEYDSNSTSLFTWFMLTKLGYDVKVGFFANKVFLLIPAKQIIFETTYFTFKKTRYYAVSFSGNPQKLEQLYTYDGSYPDADKLFDFTLATPPSFPNDNTVKDFTFKWDGKPVKFQISYNSRVINFLKDYPHTNLQIYFNSKPSGDVNYSLLTQLKPIIVGKSEFDALNILLRFVQTAFEYETDAEQFGQEKYLFPEETIHYPFSDCEDRSVLFAFLVKSFTGLKIIGLDYPGHVATAVKLSDDFDGDAVIYKDEKYVICDPTYINATVGMCMPRYKKTSPGVIEIN